jgi:hypothetical protein
MTDRLIYSAIGAAFGFLLGLVCWFLYGLAFSMRFFEMRLNASALPWIKVFVGLFAVLGFVFKDRSGSIIGDAIALLFSVESDRDHGPNLSFWKFLLWLAVIAAIIWYVVFN